MIQNLKPINTRRFSVDSSKICCLIDKLQNSEFEVQLLDSGVKVFLNTSADTDPRPFRVIYHQFGLTKERATRVFNDLCEGFQNKRYLVNLKNYPALSIQ